MAAKRMRVFAGPNGSGKTTILKGILDGENIQLGAYVNADDIERELRERKSINFSKFGLTISEEQVQEFFRSSNFSPVKRNEPDLWTRIEVNHNAFICNTLVDSYLAADLAELIRQQLLNNGISFTYETVMSHAGKIDFLHDALQAGFKVYLYFVATEDPEINISRVNVRVAQEGHAVAPDIIRNRYYKSLGNLKLAVKQTSRAYIFDNSQKQLNLIAEITNGNDVVLNKDVVLPFWVDKYLFGNVV